MPRLILLNGPPGCGKSTLARMYADAHPLTLNLDIDLVRGLIGDWRSDPEAAYPLSRAIALAAAREHLSAGYDVVVPQFLGRVEEIDRVQVLATDVGAEFHEVVLLDSKENVLRRFADRTRAAAAPGHVEAHEMLEAAGGAAELSRMYDRLVGIAGSRPSARVIPTESGKIDEAYGAFLAGLG